jgi:acyl-CoA synthetase (AMP-forming)/AMP-acid ligase II/tetratricopeptide (TPR) repeat protein
MSADKPTTIAHWLADVAKGRGSASAISGVGRRSISYAELARQTVRTGEQLSAAGVGAGDVVLVAVPDGPEALVSILGAASVAAAFPVGAHENPDRLARLFDDIDIRAVLCGDRNYEALRQMASRHGQAVVGRVQIKPDAPAGIFDLDIEVRAGATRTPPEAQDPAILIATAGTTSASKIVSSSQESIFASIAHCADWLRLTSADRSLCIMPFAHLHSLVRSTLPVLFKGGEVVSSPGFDRQRVLDWISEYRPTLVTAAPSLYKLIVQTADERRWRAPGSLRVMVTGSDRIDAQTIADTERVLGAPLVQFYGLSEVAPLVATTPLEHRLPADAVGQVNPVWSVATVDGDTVLPRGEVGEIAVRGGIINPLVGRNAPQQRMNAAGYLLTGDLGRLDGEGNLHVIGRVDDRIHRGGEKIDPRAVEEVLLALANVREATVFGIPDPVLGQRVGAAVVAAGGARLKAADIQRAAAERLFSYMVPERIVFVDALPANAAGKIARSRMAETLGIAGVAAAAPVQPEGAADEIAEGIAALFERRLAIASVDRQARFFDLGGDSFGAVELLFEVEDAFGVNVPPAMFIANNSVAALAALVGESRGEKPALRLVGLNTDGRLPPLFIPYGPEGYVAFAGMIAESLGPEQPVYSFHAPRGPAEPAEPDTMEEKAASMIELIRAVQPKGPFYLIGHSLGAHLAFEIAQQLIGAGDTVAFVGVLDDQADLQKRRFGIKQMSPQRLTTIGCNYWALHGYVPKPYPGRITLFRAIGSLPEFLSDPTGEWGDLALSGVETFDVEVDHESIVRADGFKWGALLGVVLARARHAVSLAGDRKRRKAVIPDLARHLVDARTACKRGDLKAEIAAYRRAEGAGAGPLWAMRNFGEALIASGAVDAGLKRLEEALALDPWPLKALANLIETKARLKRLDELDVLYRQAEAIVAEDADALFDFAHVCAQVGKTAQAAAVIGRALALDVKRTYGRYMRGNKYAYLAGLLTRLNRFDEAVAALKSAIECQPDNAANMAQLGTLYAHMGRRGEAATWYRAALTLDALIPGVQEKLAGLMRAAN